MRLPSLPGFVQHPAPEGGSSALIVAEAWDGPVRGAGLDRREGWLDRLAPSVAGSGRGASATLALEPGVLRLKALRRGGLAGKLWRDRHADLDRLLDNLRLPAACIERGLSTPEPVALLLESAGRGLYRGWLATREIEQAVDLAAWLRGDRTDAPIDAAGLDAAMGAVRKMHDIGFEHPDLNLGNLLLRRRAGEDGYESFVIDLDKGRLHPGALPVALRRRALLRLERSYRKLFGERGPLDDIERLYRAYAGGDAELAAAVTSGRTVGRWLMALHRLGW